MTGDGRPAKRVFMSHTAELRDYPTGGSFVAAAESAVKRSENVVVDMAYFTARDQFPAQMCRDKVTGCDLFVLIAGFHYGSPVRDHPEQSYCELEFDAATAAGVHRLVFLIDEDAQLPVRAARDLEYGRRQEAFRDRLNVAGLVTQKVTSPQQLETLLVQAFLELRSRDERTLIAKVWNIPARLPEFTGRIALLDQLAAELRAGVGPVVAQAVTGIGGVGKTSTAIEYAHRNYDRFDIAWWIPAEDPDLVPDRLAVLARTLDLADLNTPTTTAVARLQAYLVRRPRWLLVFDNAEIPDSLAPLLPRGPGHVLITSRNPGWRGIATPVGVTEFTRPESVALIRDLAPSLTAEDADRVAAALGDLPLALDQAGSLLATTTMNAKTYLHLLDRKADEILGHDTGGAYRGSVVAAWSIAFDHLADHHPSALDLLTLIAWLAPEPVPLTVLIDCPRPELLPDTLQLLAGDPLAITRDASELVRLGLAHNQPTGLILHRVPAALLRARTAHAHPCGAVQDGWAAVAVRTLRHALPEDVWNRPVIWPVWHQLFPHVLAVLDTDRDLASVVDEVAWLLDHAGSYRQTSGEPRQALPLFRRAHALYRDRLGDNHPDTLTTAGNLANNLRVLGEHDQARALNQDTFNRRRALLGDDHPDTLRSANNVANVLFELGQYERARALHEDTLTRRRRVLGDDHRDTLGSAGTLADDLRALGQPDLARTLHEETLTLSRQALGDEDPNTLATAHFLAVDLHALGQYEQARALHEDTLSRRRRVLGDDHPNTLATAHFLAVDLHALGQYEQARALHDDTLTRRRRVLGDDHPDVRRSADNLATICEALGDATRAADLRAWAARRNN